MGTPARRHSNPAIPTEQRRSLRPWRASHQHSWQHGELPDVQPADNAPNGNVASTSGGKTVNILPKQNACKFMTCCIEVFRSSLLATVTKG